MGNQLYGATQRGCECGTRYDQEDAEEPKAGSSSIRDWEAMDDSQQRMVFERVRDKMNQLKLDTVELRHERSAPLQVYVSCGTGYNLTNQLVVTGYVQQEQIPALQQLRDMVKQQCCDAVFTATSPCEGELMPPLRAMSPYDHSVSDIFGEQSLGKVVCCWFWTEGLLQQHMCRRFSAIAVRGKEEWGNDVALFEVNLVGAAPRGMSPAEGERILQLQLPDREAHDAAGLTEPCVIITNAKGRIVRRCGLKDADIEEDIKRILNNTPLAPHDNEYDRKWEMLPPDKREANMAELGVELDRYPLPQGCLDITEHRVRGYSSRRHEGDFMERYLTSVSRVSRESSEEVCGVIRLHLPGIQVLDLEAADPLASTETQRHPRHPNRATAATSPPASSPHAPEDPPTASPPPPPRAGSPSISAPNKERVFRPSAVEGWQARDVPEYRVTAMDVPVLDGDRSYARGIPSHPGAGGGQYMSPLVSQEEEEAAIRAQAESDIQAMIASVNTSMAQGSLAGSPTPPPCLEYREPDELCLQPPSRELRRGPPQQQQGGTIVTTPIKRRSASPFQPKQIVPPLCDRPPGQGGSPKVPPLKLDGIQHRIVKGEMRDPVVAREAMGRRQLDSMHEVSRDAVVATKRGQNTWVSPGKEASSRSRSPAAAREGEESRLFTDSVLSQVFLPESGDLVDIENRAVGGGELSEEGKPVAEL